MPSAMDFELSQTSYKLMHDLLRVKKDESVLITIDSAGNFRVTEEMAKMAAALGAKVMVA